MRIIPRLEPEATYTVDCRINGMVPPHSLFALLNDNKHPRCDDALHQFERWGLEFRSLSIFENQEEANRKVLARFSDVCEKQYSNLSGNRDRIARYFARPWRTKGENNPYD